MITFPPELETFVQSEVESGRYANPRAVIRDAFRVWAAQRRVTNPGLPTPPGKGDVRAVIVAMEGKILRKGVTSVSIGHVARGGQGAKSDVELVIEYDPNMPKESHSPNKRCLEMQLEEILDRRVRMATLDCYTRNLGKNFFRSIEMVFSHPQIQRRVGIANRLLTLLRRFAGLKDT